MANTSGLFSLPETDSSLEFLPSPVWGSTEGSQHFADFADSVSAHSEEAEEYIFRSGQTTPKGSRRDFRSMDHPWMTARNIHPSSQAMSRANSGRSIASSLSQNSQMSSHMISRGNDVPAFRNGSQGAASMVGMNPALVLDADMQSLPSQMPWSYELDMNLGAENSMVMGSANPLQHVSPAQMQLGPDSLVRDNSSPGSLDHFSSTISRTPSPGTDDAWLSASPHMSPDMNCQSPQ